MARVKDLWFSEVPVKGADGKTVKGPDGRAIKEKRKTGKHPDNGGSKSAKRWLACWINPDGDEETRAFRKQVEAKSYADKMEADAARGQYVAPKAGETKFGTLAEKWLRLRAVGGTTRATYGSTYRNQVEGTFANRMVKAVRPSDVLEWLRSPGMKALSGSTRRAAYTIVCGVFDLAVADKLCHENPARSPIIDPPRDDTPPRKLWDVPLIWRVRDEIPEPYREIVPLSAGLGLRQGEALALAEDDFDFDAGKVAIRRQLVIVAGKHYFKLPKEGRTRVVPLSRGLAAIAEAHIEAYVPKPYALPWMNEDGNVPDDPHTCKLLFRWQSRDRRTNGKHIKATRFNDGLWKPALARVGVFTPPPDAEQAERYFYGASDGNGTHVLRHFYSTTLQDANISPVGVTEFMGHSVKALPVTFRVYGHVTAETFEQGRQAIEKTLFRLRSVGSGGTVTELRAAQ